MLALDGGAGRHSPPTPVLWQKKMDNCTGPSQFSPLPALLAYLCHSTSVKVDTKSRALCQCTHLPSTCSSLTHLLEHAFFCGNITTPNHTTQQNTAPHTTHHTTTHDTTPHGDHRTLGPIDPGANPAATQERHTTSHHTETTGRWGKAGRRARAQQPQHNARAHVRTAAHFAMPVSKTSRPLPSHLQHTAPHHTTPLPPGSEA